MRFRSLKCIIVVLFLSTAVVPGAVLPQAQFDPVLETDSAVGIEGNPEPEQIDIVTPLTTEAEATAFGFAVDLSLSRDAGEDVSVTASADATGVDGNGGGDTITNPSVTTVTATARAFPEAITLNLFDAASANGSVQATAGALGLDGGADDDTVINTGTIDVDSEARVHQDFAVDVTLVDVTGGQVDTSIEASAMSVGIFGGSGQDGIENHGTIESTATSFISRTEDSYSAVGNLAVEAALVADVQAIGIDGGEGDDAITNFSTITVGSIASAVVNETSSSLVATDISSLDAGVTSQAFASGIEGGSGDDTITNHNLIGVTATADTFMGTMIMSALSIDNPLATASVASAPSAVAVATGINGGAGADTITNNSTINAKANPFAQSVEADASVAGLVVATAGTRSDATAVGIEGGADDDTLINAGTITAWADAMGNADSVSVALALIPVPTGLVFPFANAEAVSAAHAIGMSGWTGDDTIDNFGTITADADASMVSVEVSAKLGFSGSSGGGGESAAAGAAAFDMTAEDEPLSLQNGVADASSTRMAVATGLSGGDGNDVMTNSETGTITSDADASATGVNVNASLSIAVAPSAASVAGDAAPAATGSGASGNGQQAIADLGVLADAFGIDGDAGDDRITNNGVLDVTANVSATDVGAKVNIAIPASPLGLIGVGIGVDTKSLTDAAAGGLIGGAGDDTITNNHDITVRADATATAVSAQLNGQVTIPLILPDLFTSNVESTAAATALGIHGDDLFTSDGAGTDTITNHNLLDVDAVAKSTGVNAEAVLAGSTIADIPTDSAARATGIDAGIGSDIVMNHGDLTVDADATSTGVGVEFNLTAGAAIGFGSSTAQASATGIQGGAQLVDFLGVVTLPPDLLSLLDEITLPSYDDFIFNDAVITVNAEADSTTVFVDVLLSHGAALSFAETVATADAVGIHGGMGNDIIDTEGAINVTADADADATSVTVEAQLGVAIADNTGTHGKATAIGIHGGAGDDWIEWSESINATALSDAGSVIVTFASVGASLGFSGTNSHATSLGIQGGLNNDVLTGAGGVSSTATATSGVVSVDVSGSGASVSNAETMITAWSWGVAGGAGNDTIMDIGPVTSTASATSGAVGVEVNALGAAVGNVETNVTADARGVDGGDGDDVIVIDAMRSVGSVATATNGATGVAVNLAGAGVQNAAVHVDADATGIGGGEGVDGIQNNGTVTASATASGRSNSVTVNLLGAALGDASMTADAIATGIAGGEGSDTLDNQGTVDVDAASTMNFSSVSFTLAGAAAADVGDADTVVTTDATGMSGGDDNDTILNNGILDIDAVSTLQTGASTVVSIFGHAGTSAIVSASPQATGIDGGAGDDLIENLDTLDADVTATAVLTSGSAFTFAGAASDQAEVTASPTVTGIAGGAGLDTIRNEGSVTVSSTATLNVNSNSNVAFGVASAGAKTNATATTVGVDGGDGNDTVDNLGTIGATATASTMSSQSSYAFGGDPSTTAVVNAGSDATGIATGAGDDWVRIDTAGLIDVDANATLTSTGGAKATFDFGTVESSATVGTTVVALGVATGGGNDTLINLGMLDVDLDSTTTSKNNSNAGIIFGDSSATATATSAGDGEGVNAGDGDNTIYNEGKISIVLDDRTGSATSFAQSVTNGGDVTLDGDATSNSTATASSHIDGIVADTGNNTIMNDGVITVTSAPRAVAQSNADGDGLDGDGRGITVVGVTSVSATGILALDGDNTIHNTNSLTVTAAPVGSASSTVDGDNAGSATGRATANVSGRSVGIELGHGANLIVNEGSIVVNAIPSASASAVVGGGWAGPDSATATANATATAIGIKADDGGNEIWNTGTINVNATATASAHADDSDSGDNTPEETENISENETAYAVQTGSGNELIVNAGTGVISSSINGVAGAGTAIQTGLGEDTVRLIDDSSIVGSIALGEGDDIIAFAGNSQMTHNIFGGDGYDTLRIEDRRILTLSSGTLFSLERVEVNQGTLDLNGDFGLPPGGAFQAELFNEGAGQLSASGDATIGSGSEIIVIALPRAYVEGDTFELLVADSVGGVFASETLPSSRFISSNLVYQPDMVQLELGVVPFADVARNKVQRAVAEYLDRITPEASGDLAEVIGTFQLLQPGADFDTALTSLSPDTHDNYTQATYLAVSQYDESLSRRMRAQRLGSILPGATARQSRFVTDRSLLLAYSGDAGELRTLYADEEITARSWWRDVWGTVFGQWGEQDGDNGYTGFDYDVTGIVLGIDRYMNDRLLIGASAAYIFTDVDQENGKDDGDIDGWIASLYSSYSLNRTYIDGSLSYGQNAYKAEREIEIGTLTRTARSEHDGDVFAASLGGGYLMPVNDNILEPYGRLRYVNLDEDAFTESGAGDVNQNISSRNTESLTSEIGVRVSRIVSKVNGRLTADANVAWLNDFDIDDRTITASYTGAPASTFSMPGRDVEKNGVKLGLGLSFENKKGISTSMHYNGEFRDGFSANGIMGRIGFRF